MTETMFEAPPPDAPDAPTVEAVADTAVEQAAPVDPFDGLDPDALGDVLAGFDEQLEQAVTEKMNEMLAEAGLGPDGLPLPQMPPAAQAAVDAAAGDGYLRDAVQELAALEGFEDLAGVDTAAVIERVREVAPGVVAELGFTNEALAAALLLAATEVAGEQAGENHLASEFSLLANAYADGNGISGRQAAHARAAAEEAFAHGADVGQAVRMGFEEATGKALILAPAFQRIGYFARRGAMIRDAATAERRAASAEPAAPGPILSGRDLIAKYARENNTLKDAANQGRAAERDATRATVTRAIGGRG